MNVYTCAEAIQPLAMLFERATQEGEIQLQRWDGQRFVLLVKSSGALGLTRRVRPITAITS